jgi:hypothetical protein
VRARLGAEPTWARAAISLARMGQKQPNRALLDRDRTMKIDGCARFSADQKPPSPLAPQTLALFCSFPDAFFSSTRARE